MLLLHLNFLQNLLLFISSISVGRGMLQKERHSSMMSLFAVLNNFIENLMTTKSRECRSALSMSRHNLRPYRRMGWHLLFANWRVTSSEAILPTLPNIAFVDRLNERLALVILTAWWTAFVLAPSAPGSNLAVPVTRTINDRPAHTTRHHLLSDQRLILSVSKPSISQRSQIKEDTVEPSVLARDINLWIYISLTCMHWQAARARMWTPDRRGPGGQTGHAHCSAVTYRCATRASILWAFVNAINVFIVPVFYVL